jgi:hypothetical protein
LLGIVWILNAALCISVKTLGTSRFHHDPKTKRHSGKIENRFAGHFISLTLAS